jgi:hypothetical protein
MATPSEFLFDHKYEAQVAHQEELVSRVRQWRPDEVSPNLNRALSLNPLHNLNLHLTLALMSEQLANPSIEV